MSVGGSKEAESCLLESLNVLLEMLLQLISDCVLSPMDLTVQTRLRVTSGSLPVQLKHCY